MLVTETLRSRVISGRLNPQNFHIRQNRVNSANRRPPETLIETEKLNHKISIESRNRVNEMFQMTPRRICLITSQDVHS